MHCAAIVQNEFSQLVEGWSSMYFYRHKKRHDHECQHPRIRIVTLKMSDDKSYELEETEVNQKRCQM